jgi:alpha-galactosidase
VKLKVIQGMADQKIPADLYWIDAGWYEPLSLKQGEGYNVNSDWAGNRGDWIMSKSLYPDGMKPLGEALKSAGIGFLLWIEAETANTNANRVKEHPDWYIGKGDPMFLNLGNPEAFKSITDQVSGIITDNELTWYRQDFNFSPAGYWASADTPDRVGMSEIKSITGLYAYWDKLRELHPGLQIDNCASGGRRLDIETMSRSVALWRSDNAGDPIGEQYHTVGLMPWVPLTAGVWITLKGQGPAFGNPEQLYQQRSGYGAGMTVCIDQDPAPWVKTAFDEFHEVRPYYLENFYPLLPQTREPGSWAGWQLQKRDGKSGLLVVLRRPGSPYSTIQLDLHAIDPAASYDVEVRYGAEKGKVQTVAGKELAHYALSIPDKPGSALVFYAKH